MQNPRLAATDLGNQVEIHLVHTLLTGGVHCDDPVDCDACTPPSLDERTSPACPSCVWEEQEWATGSAAGENKLVFQ